MSRFILLLSIFLSASLSFITVQAADPSSSTPAPTPGQGQDPDRPKFPPGGPRAEKPHLPNRDGLDEPFVFSRLEKQLRRELTPEQKSEIRKAFESFFADAREIENAFVQKVSEITDIPAEKVSALRPTLLSGAHPRRGSPAALYAERLETLTKKPLTGAQLRQIQDAYEDREKNLQKANDDLAKAIAETTHLTVNKVREVVFLAR